MKRLICGMILGIMILSSQICFGLEIIASTDFTLQPEAIVISNKTAYIAGTNGLTLIDVENPNSPTSLSSVAIPLAKELDILGIRAYIITDNEFFLVNVSDPNNPYIEGQLTNSWEGKNLRIQAFNFCAYIGSESGLHVIDITESDNPILLNTYSELDSTNNSMQILDFEISSRNYRDYVYAILASSTEVKMKLIDITNPFLELVAIDGPTIHKESFELELSSGSPYEDEASFLCVLEKTSLKTFDYFSLDSPEELDQLDLFFTTPAKKLAVFNESAYLINDNQFCAILGTNQLSLRMEGYLETPAVNRDFYIEWPHAYLITEQGELTVVQIPTNLLGSISGEVINEDDTPVINAVVTLQDTPYSTTTDETGEFEFNDLPISTYMVQVTSPEIVTQEKKAYPIESFDYFVFFPVESVVEKDLDDNGKIELKDAIWGLQVVSEIKPGEGSLKAVIEILRILVEN